MTTRSKSALSKLRQLYTYAKNLETLGKPLALTIKTHLLNCQNCGEMTTAEVLALHEKIRSISEEFYCSQKKGENS